MTTRETKPLPKHREGRNAMIHYTDLYFGMSDGKNEAEENPDQFLRSFVNRGNEVERITSGKAFLALGPKGTGKSALAWYLALTQGTREEIVATRDISEIPFSDVENLKTGEPAGLGRTVTAWRLMLLCGLLNVIVSDPTSSLNRDPEASQVILELRKRGFLDPTPRRAVIEGSRETLRFSVPSNAVAFSNESTSRLPLYGIVPLLESWILENESQKSYMLVIDGLDSIYLNDPRYSTVLAALLQAAYLLYQSLKAAHAKTSLLLLVRNDLFSRLNLADAGKMRRDRGVDLDWRVLTGNPAKSALFTLVNTKSTALLDAPPLDVVTTYFPAQVQLGGRTGRGAPTFVDTYRYLLELTRHTPRDLLQLLSYIQETAREISDPWKGKVTDRVIREGVVRYSSKYFVDAISNELFGWGAAEEGLTQRALDALRSVPRQFTLEQYTAELLGDSSKVNQNAAAQVLRWLFFAGAIGNVRPNFDQSYMQFYHRREQSDIYLKGKFVRHTALNYASGEPW